VIAGAVVQNSAKARHIAVAATRPGSGGALARRCATARSRLKSPTVQSTPGQNMMAASEPRPSRQKQPSQQYAGADVACQDQPVGDNRAEPSIRDALQQRRISGLHMILNEASQPVWVRLG
jgi:hypothetical protein